MAPLFDQVLMTSYFRPLGEGAFNEDHIAHYLGKYDESDVRLVLAALVEQGFATPHEAHGWKGSPLLVATDSGWRMRESLLRRYGRRHKSLLSADSSLEDMLVAILNRPQPPAGYFASENEFSFLELGIYLARFDDAVIIDASNNLIARGLAAAASRSVHGVNYPGIKPTLKGERVYENEVRSRLQIVADSWILAEQIRDRIGVFFAWQSDFGTSRNNIQDALSRLEEEAAGWALVAPLIVEQAVEPKDGAVRIDSTLQDKIANADLFVGDITPVYAYDGKLCPNPNVLIEVGFALASLAAPQVVLIERARDGETIPGDGVRGTLPFDIRQVHRIRYTEPKDLRRSLVGHVRERLRVLGLLL